MLRRNNTSFPVQITSRLRDLRKAHRRLLETTRGTSGGDAHVARALKYYQYLVRAVFTDPEFGLGAAGNGRGLLVYHEMGKGKTRLAVAVALALWDVRIPVVIVPKSIQPGFRKTVRELIALFRPKLEGERLAAAQDKAEQKFRFVTLDAHNMAAQVARATAGVDTGGPSAAGDLSGRLLIVDEAHNLFRAIINSPNEKTNARQLYDMVMAAQNLRILFLSGTPVSKDPFELVPCFNMLTGGELLPPQYDRFVSFYVDEAAGGVKNRDKLANRLVGLVSYAGHGRGLSPPDSSLTPAAAAERAQGLPPSDFPELRETIVERVEMSPDQYRQYLLAREKEEAEGKGGEGGPPRGDAPPRPPPPLALPGRSEAKGGRSYYTKSRKAGNFAPPRDERDLAVANMSPAAFTPATSPKAARIAELTDESPGPVLIYSQFVKHGGVMVGRYLETVGYQKFDPSDAVSPEKLSRRKRYALFTGDVPTKHRDEVLRVFNSAHNAHGELIKALIVSKTGTEGLDLKGVRLVLHLEPYWDKSLESQVDHRGARLGSHAHLPPDERVVQPYLFVAAPNQEMLGAALAAEKRAASGATCPPRDARGGRRRSAVERTTTDERFHERALQRYQTILAFRRLLQAVAIECGAGGAEATDTPCHLCVPTDSRLFDPDPARDLQLPDPCRQLAEAEVEVSETEFDGTSYYYKNDPSAPLGFTFYEYSEELESYTPIGYSTGLYERLVDHVSGDSAGDESSDASTA